MDQMYSRSLADRHTHLCGLESRLQKHRMSLIQNLNLSGPDGCLLQYETFYPQIQQLDQMVAQYGHDARQFKDALESTITHNNTNLPTEATPVGSSVTPVVNVVNHTVNHTNHANAPLIDQQLVPDVVSQGIQAGVGQMNQIGDQIGNQLGPMSGHNPVLSNEMNGVYTYPQTTEQHNQHVVQSNGRTREFAPSEPVHVSNMTHYNNYNTVNKVDYTQMPTHGTPVQDPVPNQARNVIPNGTPNRIPNVVPAAETKLTELYPAQNVPAAVNAVAEPVQVPVVQAVQAVQPVTVVQTQRARKPPVRSNKASKPVVSVRSPVLPVIQPVVEPSRGPMTGNRANGRNPVQKQRVAAVHSVQSPELNALRSNGRPMSSDQQNGQSGPMTTTSMPAVAVSNGASNGRPRAARLTSNEDLIKRKQIRVKRSSYKYGGARNGGFDVWKRNMGRPLYTTTNLRVNKSFRGEERLARKWMSVKAGFDPKEIEGVTCVNREETPRGRGRGRGGRARGNGPAKFTIVRVRASLRDIFLRIAKLDADPAFREGVMTKQNNRARTSRDREPNQRLHVSNFDILDAQCHRKLTSVFLKYGDLETDIVIQTDRQQNPFAIVTYRSLSAAERCCREQESKPLFFPTKKEMDKDKKGYLNRRLHVQFDIVGPEQSSTARAYRGRGRGRPRARGRGR